MKLYGMLDSPYVRRVAISLDLLGVPFEHEPLSVFSSFEAFAQVNPVVKAPTLTLDDDTVLMDSTLIIDYFETLSAPAARLLPAQAQARSVALRTVGLGLAACEKAVQVVYEHNLRPSQKLHQPWVDRITQQLLAACHELENQVAKAEPTLASEPDQAAVTTAVTWSFIQLMVPDVVKSGDFPVLHTFTDELERTALFQRYPIV